LPPVFTEKPVLYFTVQPANPVKPCPNRTTRRRAAAEVAVANIEVLPHTNTAAVPFPVQPADAPAPEQPSPNIRHRATVEDANDDDNHPFVSNATVPLPCNPPIHIMFDVMPQRHQDQEDPVNEGGPIEGKTF
jgi:hypothetical protein